jgi:hypothetical protein
MLQLRVTCYLDAQTGFYFRVTLAVSMLASGTQDRGFDTVRKKKSTACHPSEGKQNRLSHVADLRHVKEPCDLRGSRNRRSN